MTPIAFPWPPHGLNPNHKIHWAAKARVVKTYKQWCNTVLMVHRVKKFQCDRVKLTFKFIPPDRRVRDLDNCEASVKNLIDCISQAIGVDDSRFEYGAPTMEGTVKHGAVVVTIEPIIQARAA